MNVLHHCAVRMAEWSKALRSQSTLVGVGSNPTSDIIIFKLIIILTKKNIIG